MKLLFFLRIVFLAGCLTSCGNSNDQNEAELKDPAVTHPPGEAIPDSMNLVNDSVIVPENRPDSEWLNGISDTPQRDR